MGFWRGLFRQCPHDRQRCLHGDAILAFKGKRARCLDCGRALPDLPPVCSVTGQPH